jgi:hypothetical protein
MTQDRALTRRAFLKTTGGLGLGSVLFRSTAAQGEGLDETSGMVARVSPPTLEIEERKEEFESVRILVDLSRAVTVWRDEPVHVDDFLVGDEVAVEGRRLQGNRFEGHHIAPLYRLREGLVVGRSEGELATTGGTVTLTHHSQARESWDLVAIPLHQVKVGDTIRTIGRVDPSLGFVGLLVGVVKTV